MNTKLVPMSPPTTTTTTTATAVMLFFAGLVLLAAKPTSGLTIPWGADTPSILASSPVQLPQCEDLTFRYSGTNSIIQFQTKDKFERCDFNRSLTVLSTKNNGVYTIAGSSLGHKRGNAYFGSDFLDLCDRTNMKMQIEIIPSFTAHMDTMCVRVEGRKPISRISVGSISRCEKACVKKDECLGFEFNPQASNDCMLFDFAPEPIITMVPASSPAPSAISSVAATGNETQAPVPVPVGNETQAPTSRTPQTAAPTPAQTVAPTSILSATPSAIVTQAPTRCVLPGGKCELDGEGNAISQCCSVDNFCVASRCITSDPPTTSPTSMPSYIPSSSPTPAPSSSPSSIPTELTDTPSSIPSETTDAPSSMPSSVCITAGNLCTLDTDGKPIDPCCSEGHVCMAIGSRARCVTSDAPTMMPTSSATQVVVPPLDELTERTGGNLRKRGRARLLTSNEDMAKTVVRRPVERALQQEPIAGAACYAGLSSCPAPPAPHCSVDAEVTCAVFNNTSVKCKDAASLLPSGVTAGDEACEIRLEYTTRAIIRTRTFYPDVSTTTWAKRTRKGGEPMSFARPREYDWLANKKILDKIPGAGVVPFMSTEEVVVDFCSKDTYKTLAEFVVMTDASTICTGRDQYKLGVEGL